MTNDQMTMFHETAGTALLYTRARRLIVRVSSLDLHHEVSLTLVVASAALGAVLLLGSGMGAGSQDFSMAVYEQRALRAPRPGRMH